MRPPREPCPPPMQFSGPHREAAHQEGGWVGASPGRTFRKSLFHTVSLMSAWCRPGLKEMGLNAPSKSRACWSSALGAVVHSEGGGLTVHPAPSSECRSNQPIRSSEARAHPVLPATPLRVPPPSGEGKHTSWGALQVQAWGQQQHLGACKKCKFSWVPSQT